MHLKRKNELDVMKEHLINAHKDKKIFEILKDKAVKANLKEKESSAQKEADYLVLARKLR
jgi:flagellar biosynthesis chaperone FliJ